MWHSRIFSAKTTPVSASSQRQPRMWSMLTSRIGNNFRGCSTRAGAFDFSPHPFAVHAVPREHQQQAVVDLDGHGRLIRRIAETEGWTSAAPASTLATHRIACDFNIVAGTNNWGAMALAAATSVCSVIESMSWSLGRKRGSSTSWRMAPPSTASPADARQPLMGFRS